MKEGAVTLLLLITLCSSVSAEQDNDAELQFVNRWVSASTDIHFNKLFCSECHTKLPDKSGSLYLRFEDIIETCRCHGYTSETYTHPVNIEPSPEKKAKIPAEFPLIDNKITCQTCHIISLQCKPDQAEKKKNPKFLRSPSYLSRTAICFRCHDERKYRVISPHNQLDAKGRIVEEKCLYCHTEKPDEKTASVRAEEGSGQPVHLIGDFNVLCYRCHYKQSRFHPVNANHLRRPSREIYAYMRKSEREFGIVLPLDRHGQVTCATCHNPHERGVIPSVRAESRGASEKARLRMPIAGDRICLACHKNKMETGRRR